MSYRLSVQRHLCEILHHAQVEHIAGLAVDALHADGLLVGCRAREIADAGILVLVPGCQAVERHFGGSIPALREVQCPRAFDRQRRSLRRHQHQPLLKGSGEGFVPHPQGFAVQRLAQDDEARLILVEMKGELNTAVATAAQHIARLQACIRQPQLRQTGCRCYFHYGSEGRVERIGEEVNVGIAVATTGPLQLHLVALERSTFRREVLDPLATLQQSLATGHILEQQLGRPTAPPRLSWRPPRSPLPEGHSELPACVKAGWAIPSWWVASRTPCRNSHRARVGRWPPC